MSWCHILVCLVDITTNLPGKYVVLRSWRCSYKLPVSWLSVRFALYPVSSCGKLCFPAVTRCFHDELHVLSLRVLTSSSLRHPMCLPVTFGDEAVVHYDSLTCVCCDSRTHCSCHILDSYFCVCLTDLCPNDGSFIELIVPSKVFTVDLQDSVTTDATLLYTCSQSCSAL